MGNVTEVLENMFFIGYVVVKFLLNTNRVLKAIELSKECVLLLNNKALEKEQEFVSLSYIVLYRIVLKGYRLINDHTSGIECCRNLLVVFRRCGDKDREGGVIIEMAAFHQDLGNHKEAKGLYEKALSITIETGQRRGEATCYGNLGNIFQCLGEYGKANEHLQKALAIRKELDDRGGEASCYGNLASVFQSLSEYHKAEEYLEKALVIAKEVGDKKGEAVWYGNLGTVFQSLSKYDKAEEYLQKALSINKEIGDIQGRASVYGNLATVFNCRGEYANAQEYLQRALEIKRETGDRNGEATFSGTLGTVFCSLGEYAKAEEYLQKGLDISKEIGDRDGEAAHYGNLATVFQSLGEYVKAEEYLQKALPIRKETGDKYGEAADYGNLGTLFYYLGDYAKAEEYLQKALAIREKIGDRHGEVSCYGNLAPVFVSLGKYLKAEEYLQKALAIRKEIGDRQGEAKDYANLETVLYCVGDYVKADEYLGKSLAISKEIGDRIGEASCYEKKGKKFLSLGEYAEAEEYLHKSLEIRQKLGDRKGEASCFGKLGTVFRFRGDYVKAKEFVQKALVITNEIGDRSGEAANYRNMGTTFHFLGEYAKARDYHEKALVISKEIGDIEGEFLCHFQLTFDRLLEGNIDGAFVKFFASIHKCEDMRTSLENNDQFKVSFFDVGYVLTYRVLSELFCATGNPSNGLYIVDLGRARALADLMSADYSVPQISVTDPQSWAGFERIIQKEISGSACTCLYISYVDESLFLWILKANKPILFQKIDANDCLNTKGSAVRRNVEEIFGNETFRRFHNLPREHCEDRSFFPSNAGYPTRKSSLADDLEALRLVEEEPDEDQRPDPTFSQCYNMLIAPVANLLDGPELIIVPDRHLYKVPFPALSDEKGKLLAETFRIRIVPSLMTLKLIQDSPVDYHSQTGALIVGEPKVDQVYYRGRIENLCPLPAARKEAEMIGRLLRAQPLLGQQATKQGVLHSIHSVALIHFAAHGNAERGEIALAPQFPNSGIPQEDDYLLTMADISRVRLRAKLVVLSCCHSARGQIRSEGVVGIARAFLGSGARSVLVALWALEDKATELFMSRFYEHLVHGESASESLHQAMKWMRENGFSDVGQWAPFMLIGDNVTFTLGK